MPHGGTPSAFLISKSADEFKGFGTLSRYFRGSDYLGKRIRLRGWIKSDKVTGWAGLWMRIDAGQGEHQRSAAFDNMQHRSIQETTGWKPYDIVLDVPRDATGIGMGILLTGPGKVWLSGVKLEIVPRTVPTTDLMLEANGVHAGPVNLGFHP